MYREEVERSVGGRREGEREGVVEGDKCVDREYHFSREGGGE